MEHLIAFWETYRNEILMTVLTIVGIHVITGLGGFASKRRGGAKRVEGAGLPGKGAT